MEKRQTDELIATLASYVSAPLKGSEASYQTAALTLLDALGCALLALTVPDCRRLLGPTAPGTVVPHGCRVPGTAFILDPVQGAFNIGTMIRWLDYNDTWLAKEWGHPSDNIGGLLAVLDYRSRKESLSLTVHDLLTAMIKAYEIQGILALSNSFNRVGIDHVILVKVATAAVAAHLLGGSEVQVAAAISEAFVDTGPLRCYRHYPNVSSRKSWAAGDATSRGVLLAMLTLKGELKGEPTALSSEGWGLQDVLLSGKPLTLSQPLKSYVMENILFKVSFPAEFHGQTAIEAALKLRPHILKRFSEIDTITIETQEPAMRIIDKKGILTCPADRDHCLQYMVAAALLNGNITKESYEEPIANDPKLESLRKKITVKENPAYTESYYAPQKRAIANSLTITFKESQEKVKEEVLYPLGHKKRREEALPLIYDKFRFNVKESLPHKNVEKLLELSQNYKRLSDLSLDAFMTLFL